MSRADSFLMACQTYYIQFNHVEYNANDCYRSAFLICRQQKLN